MAGREVAPAWPAGPPARAAPGAAVAAAVNAAPGPVLGAVVGIGSTAPPVARATVTSAKALEIRSSRLRADPHNASRFEIPPYCFEAVNSFELLSVTSLSSTA